MSDDSFELNLRWAAQSKWQGSPAFAGAVVEAILKSEFADALDTLWRMGGLELFTLVAELGTDFCEADAACARGETRGESRRKTTQAFFRRMWGAVYTAPCCHPTPQSRPRHE